MIIKNLKVETIVHNSALEELIKAQHSLNFWRAVYDGFQRTNANNPIRKDNGLMKFYKDSKAKVK